MKTSAIEVHDMLSVFSVDEVEKRIGEVAGVASVTVNYAAGNATVRFDETRLAIADIQSSARQHLSSTAPVDSATPGSDSAVTSRPGEVAPSTEPRTKSYRTKVRTSSLRRSLFLRMKPKQETR